MHVNYICIRRAKKEILDANVYQVEMLQKYFSKYYTLYENIIDSLELKHALKGDVGNMILMLDFLNDHEPIFVKNLPRPTYISSTSVRTHLEHYNNALLKLQITSTCSNNIFKYIDKTLTCTGKKKLKSLLYSPSCEVSVLEKRYDSVDLFLNNRFLFEKTKTHLKICDMERLYRRFAIGRIDPYGDIPRIQEMNTRIKVLLETFTNVEKAPYWIPPVNVIHIFDTYIQDLESTFDMNACTTGTEMCFKNMYVSNSNTCTRNKKHVFLK